MDPNDPDAAIAFLHANDPAHAEDDVDLTLYLRLYTSNQLDGIGDALVLNTVIQGIFIDFSDFDETDENLESLLVGIECKENLRRVKFLNNARSSSRITSRFMHAISRNEWVIAFQLNNATIPALSLISLLEVSESISTIHIARCVFQAPDNSSDAAGRLANAFGENQNIRSLWIDFTDMLYLEPMVKRLQHHHVLDELMFLIHPYSVGPGPAELQIIRSVLAETTSSTLKVGLLGFDFNEDNFPSLATDATAGSVVKLMIAACTFDHKATQLFETMFTSTSKLRSLTLLSDNSFIGKETDCVLKSLLLQANSSLNELRVLQMGSRALEISTAIMDSLRVNTSLGHLYIEEIEHPDVFHSFCTGITHMIGLKRLECIGLHSETFEKQVLMESLKRNSSITEFNCYDVEVLQWDAGDKKRLESFATRNKHLPTLVKTPGVLPLGAWANVFERAQECEYGNSFIYEALLNMADKLGNDESDVGGRTLRRSKRRRR